MLFNGTTSRVQNNTADFNAGNAKYSVMVFFKATTLGETSNGRLLCADEASPNFQCRLVAGNNIRLRRDFATDFGSWDIGMELNKWICFAATHNASSVSNNPNMYSRVWGTDSALVLRSETETNTPAGGLSGIAAGYCIGNKNDQAETFNGDICFVQFWTRILTYQELQQAMLRPGSVREGLTLNMWLLDDFADRSGMSSHGTTISAMAKSSMPPGITPYQPRALDEGLKFIRERPYYYRNFVLDKHRRNDVSFS